MEANNNFNEFCKNKDCEEYIAWDFGYGICVSCKRVGQSYNIEEYPNNCLFLDEIQEYDIKNEITKKQ